MKAVLPETTDTDMRLRLSELLCTRFCHDITGPVGAVNNGVEFLREEGEELLDQAIGLIEDSAKQAISRIQFYRQCYGRVNHSGEANLEELREIVLDYFNFGKITFEWPKEYTDSPTYSFSRKMGKLMLNLILIASECLIRGGNMAITMHQGEETKEFKVVAEGESLKCDESIVAIFNGKMNPDALDPRTAQVYMTLLLAAELNAEIDYNYEDGRFTLMATRWK